MFMFGLKALTKKLTLHRRKKKPSSPNIPKETLPLIVMDPDIWSRLPDEILDLILWFLPFNTLMNFRSTCKRFRSLILSPTTLLFKHCSISPTSSFLLLTHPRCYNCFPLYDSDLRTWRRLALPTFNPISIAEASVGNKRCTLVSSSDGLLCFSRPTSYASPSSIIVIDILARSSSSINFPFYPFPLELLTLIRMLHGFRIITLCPSSSDGGFLSPNSPRRVYIFDSVDFSWREFEGFHETLASGSQSHQEGVSYRGYLHFAKTKPFLIVSFDHETGIWRSSAGNGVINGNEIRFARLVKDPEKGGMYLVGGLRGSNGISKSIKLWKVGRSRETNGELIWDEMETVPETIFRKFMTVCCDSYENVYCFWHNGMVCLCSYNSPEVLLCYEMERRVWNWVGKCPNLPDVWRSGSSWFSFLPHP